MRSDMAKVIVERARVGGGCKPKDRRERQRMTEREEMPYREKIRHALSRHYNRKQLNENLRPLYNWLESQVGRPWDKVYSEMRERIDLRSATQLHIAQHAYGAGGRFGHVELHVEELPDGRVIEKTGTYRSTVDRRELYYGRLYVCPRTGLLKMYRRNRSTRYVYRRPEEPKQQVCVVASEKLCYMKRGATWFALTLAQLPTDMETVEVDGVRTSRVRQVVDVWFDRKVSRAPRIAADGRYIGVQRHVHYDAAPYGEKNQFAYCVTFRQVGGAEANKLGLNKAA